MEINPWYITGLVDGEGSFLVSFSIRKKLTVGIETRPSFTISQHRRNRLILEEVQRFFHCGGIRYNKSDQTYKYEVRSMDDLARIIIPHFARYPLRTTKRGDFRIFRDICRSMRSNLHLSMNGIKTIIEQAYTMNNLGARRYEKENLLTVVGR